jgi:hypothetical protein
VEGKRVMRRLWIAAAAALLAALKRVEPQK